MKMAHYLDRYVNESHDFAWRTFDCVKAILLSKKGVKKWKTPGEPALVSTLLSTLFEQRHLEWTARYLWTSGPGKDVEKIVASGLFIHQKPKIKASRAHVELGDMLIVRQHFTYGVSEPECRALLLQAKTHTSSKIAKLSDKKELEQFGIYNGWKTKFVFPHNEIGPPPAPATKWCFATSPMPNPEKSGWYAVAFNDRRANYISGFPNDCIWGVGPAQVGKGKPAIDANVSMGEVIAGVLKGTEGREWTATPKPDDHWSIFVKRILAVALRDQWKYPVQRIGVSNSERIRQIVFPIATFACMGTNAGQKMSAFTGATPHFSPSLNNDDVDDQLMGIRKWIESIGGESDRLPPSGGGDGGDYGKRPLRAPSILYLGTIGPRRLSEMSPKNLDLD